MWADHHIALHVGDHLVGVRVDSASTADAVRARCGELLADESPTVTLPAAFSVRAPSRSLRRRNLALLYYGSCVIHRARSLDEVVEALHGVVIGIPVQPGHRQVVLDLRVFVRGQRAVLAAVSPPWLTGDQRLARRGITEVPRWRAVVDVERAEVVVADHRWELAGIVGEVEQHSIEATLQSLWAMAEGDRSGWARLLDERRDDIDVSIDHGRTAIVERLSPRADTPVER
ncbi:MAG: hypothetical protein M3501_01670 [Actinomycetota bacterium]|nr:hypothetical protein [Actinomycetota bacterium]